MRFITENLACRCRAKIPRSHLAAPRSAALINKVTCDAEHSLWVLMCRKPSAEEKTVYPSDWAVYCLTWSCFFHLNITKLTGIKWNLTLVLFTNRAVGGRGHDAMPEYCFHTCLAAYLLVSWEMKCHENSPFT